MPSRFLTPKEKADKRELAEAALDPASSWYRHSFPATDILALLDENESLSNRLEDAQLRSIEARNPGIDMEEVRRYRSNRRILDPQEGDTP